MWRTLCLAVPLLLGTLVLGCSDDDDPVGPEPEPSPYLPPTSPENVLANLQIAFELRDAEGLADLLYAPEYRFALDPRDLQDNPDLPRHWGYDCEEALIDRMFDSPDVLGITLSFNTGSAEDALPEDEAGDPSWKRIMITALELEVETVNPDDPTDNIIYKVSGDRALFLFAQDPTEIVEGEPAWKITEWRDNRIGTRPGEWLPASTIDNSFGTIKSLYSLRTECATLQPTNPRFALENFKDAYNSRDLDDFNRVFYSDSYLFFFDPADARDPEIPDTWGWEEERSAHEALFTSSRVNAVELNFRRGPVSLFDIEPAGARRLEASAPIEEVHLAVSDGVNSPVEYVVEGAIATFGLIPDESETAFGYPLWKIAGWSDRQADPLTSISTSWGRLKHDYYLPPATYEEPSSPAAVVRNLRRAYERRDTEAFEDCLDLSEFVFSFDPVDLEDDPDLPVSWGAADERLVTENMFQSGQVYNVDLSYMLGSVEDVTEADGEGVDLSWKKMTVTGVELEIWTWTPTDPTDTIIYKVSGDRALFFFAADGSGPEPVWRIVRWRDVRIGAVPPVLEMSWGQVKVLFR